MLARVNRVVAPVDFRTTVRRGHRTSTRSAVYYRRPTDPLAPLRFGIIAARSVGNAVERNQVKRRLRALGRQRVEAGHLGEDVVIRVNPGAAQRSWDSLGADMQRALDTPPNRPATNGR